MILDERSLTTVLFKMNNESFNLCEHEAENRDLNDYLLIRSLFTKITLNENCERLYSCFLIYIKTIFTMCFIMNDDKSIINLLLCLIVAFNLFRDERDDFKSEKNSSSELESKLFEKKRSAREDKKWSCFYECLRWCDLIYAC